MKLVECVPNFSEGRRKEVIDAILNAARETSGVTVLDCESDPNHNRMVLTLVGEPETAKTATLSAAAKAIELIDLTKHTGEHPRIGAVDVVPFVPLKDVSMEDCIQIANEFAKEFSSRFNVPVFMYEAAAKRPERRNLAQVREGQFEGLRELMGKDSSRDPDYGPRTIHPTAGATAVGARPILIAYNVNLKTTDLSVAKKIAKKVRERDGGLPCVKALGFELRDRNMVQVSMNLTDFTKTSMHTAYDAVSRFAEGAGVEVNESEVVGLVPLDALVRASTHYLKLKDFRSEQIIENRIFALVAPKSSGVIPIDFTKLTLSEFTTSVATKDPIPGGGSVAAYVGALAAALVAMVCRLTLGKKGYESVQEMVNQVLKSALEYESSLRSQVNKDAEAYSLVSDALCLPRDSVEEKGIRARKLNEAYRLATEVPVQTMQLSYKVFHIAMTIIEIGNKNARSDAETAVELSKAAIRGAWCNVKLNLESLAEEKDYVERIEKQVRPLLEI